VTLGSSATTLKDSAVLSGGVSPTGSITFKLYRGSTLDDTETATVDGNGTYSTPKGYTLPSSGTVTGTYQWDASYGGDGSNSASSDANNPDDQVVVRPGSPNISIRPNVTSAAFGTSRTLTDTVSLTGGADPTGSVTFTLLSPTHVNIDSEVVTVTGDGTYSTPHGYKLPTTNTSTVAGIYQWDVRYSGNSNNAEVADDGAADGRVVVTQATTATSYMGTDDTATNSSFVPVASLKSATTPCEVSQPVTFSLPSNPLSGKDETYNLRSAASSATGIVRTAPISTRNWRDGVYLLTTSDAGTANCAASRSYEVLTVSAPGLFAFGGGAYNVPGLGQTSSGFTVKRTTEGRSTSYSGVLSVVTTGRWLFTANVKSLRVSSSTQVRFAGAGNLYLWNSSINGRGGWTLVKSGVAYHAIANATSKGFAGSFGIAIDYTPTRSQPALPGYGAVTISHGRIYIG
jgi:hypothetical protein